MSKAVTPRGEQQVVHTITRLQRRAQTQERLSSGTHSIGSIAFRPGVKAGIPSDADYPANAQPPIGWIVFDSVNSKLWVRAAVGVWKGVVVA